MSELIRAANAFRCEWCGRDPAYRGHRCKVGREHAATITRMAKRGYSREFRPHGDSGKRYLLDDIPAGLWTAVRDKCKREGVSVRAQILKLLKAWIEGRSGADGE